MTVNCKRHKKDEKGNVRWSTDDEKMKVLDTVAKQYRAAFKGEDIKCADCKRKFSLLRTFRCYYCGRYYCVICAGNHFDGSRFK
jgi:hypothetical protein